MSWDVLVDCRAVGWWYEWLFDYETLTCGTSPVPLTQSLRQSRRLASKGPVLHGRKNIMRKQSQGVSVRKTNLWRAPQEISPRCFDSRLVICLLTRMYNQRTSQTICFVISEMWTFIKQWASGPAARIHFLFFVEMTVNTYWYPMSIWQIVCQRDRDDGFRRVVNKGSGITIKRKAGLQNVPNLFFHHKVVSIVSSPEGLTEESRGRRGNWAYCPRVENLYT